MLDTCFLIGGFASPRFYYWPLQKLLENRGFDVGFLQTGWVGINIWPLADFVKQAEKIIQQNPKPQFLIGHSLGGIQAIWLASMFPQKIKKVITLGCPVWGTPFEVYDEAIRSLLRVSKEEHNHFKNQMVPACAERIVTISSRYDVIAPPDLCFINGAKNITLNWEIFDTVGTMHLILPYLMTTVKIIEDEINGSISGHTFSRFRV